MTYSPAQIDAQIRQAYALTRDGVRQKTIANKMGISLGTFRKRINAPCPPDPAQEKAPDGPSGLSKASGDSAYALIDHALRASIASGVEKLPGITQTREYQETVAGIARASAELAKLHGLSQKAGQPEIESDTGGKVIAKVPTLMVVRT